MRKILLTLLLSGIWFLSTAQTTSTLPSGYTPFATQLYYKIAGGDTTIISGATGKGFHVLQTTQALRDSLDLYYTKTESDARFVPLTRTLTINGTSQNLSSNRSWSVTIPSIPGLSDSLLNKANRDFNNVDSGQIRKNPSAVYKPVLRIGTGTSGSTQTGVQVSMVLNDALLTETGHAFSDATDYNVTGMAYNSYDAMPRFGGSTTQRDHYVGYQFGPYATSPQYFKDVSIVRSGSHLLNLYGENFHGMYLPVITGTWDNKYVIYSQDTTARIDIRGLIKTRSGGLEIMGTSRFGTTSWPTNASALVYGRHLIASDALILWNKATPAVNKQVILNMGSSYGSDTTTLAGLAIRPNLNSTTTGESDAEIFLTNALSDNGSRVMRWYGGDKSVLFDGKIKLGAVPTSVTGKQYLAVRDSTSGEVKQIRTDQIQVTTNANLTGPITSVGNATSVASQTGTGSTFVMNTSPALVTPNIGAATFSTLTGGTASTITFANTSAGSVTDAISIRNGGTSAGTGNRINFITGTSTQSARINSVLTSSSVSDLVFSTMTGSTLAEAGRFTGAGLLTVVGGISTTTGSFGGALTGTSATFNSGKLRLGADGSYGSSYSTISFGGTSSNGDNRIFAGNDLSDDLYIAAGTGKSVNIWANGSSANVASFASTGITFSSLSGSGNILAYADNTGLLGKVTIGSGLSLTGTTLSATGGSAGTITGSGTAGKIAKFNSASDIGNSIMTEAGSDISIAGSLSATSINANSGELMLKQDVTYGVGYSTVSFGGTGANGDNRIFAGNDNLDDIFVAAGTGRKVVLRANGSTGDVATFSSTAVTLNQALAATSGVFSSTLSASNLSGTNTGDQTWTTLSGKPSFATVATSGDYNDLINKPTITSGTVTSVGATAGTGISVSGSPITTSGSITITNTAPDQTVSLTAGTGISTSGTYPNFTITNTAPSLGGTVSSIVSGSGMGFSTITGTGTITMGTPSSITSSSTNSTSTTSHTHAITSLPSATTATTQTAGDNSTKIATTAYVDGGYLKLSGGTLTGTLNGTSAVFSGDVTANSDSTLKYNIKPLVSVTTALRNSIGAYSYNWKSNGRKSIGLIAQEIQKYFPELVKEDSKGILSVNYQNFAAVLLAGWKELDERILKLEQK